MRALIVAASVLVACSSSGKSNGESGTKGAPTGKPAKTTNAGLTIGPGKVGKQAFVRQLARQLVPLAKKRDKAAATTLVQRVLQSHADIYLAAVLDAKHHALVWCLKKHGLYCGDYETPNQPITEPFWDVSARHWKALPATLASGDASVGVVPSPEPKYYVSAMMTSKPKRAAVALLQDGDGLEGYVALGFVIKESEMDAYKR